MTIIIITERADSLKVLAMGPEVTMVLANQFLIFGTKESGKAKLW